MTSARHLALLRHLTSTTWRRPPRGVGLKTMLQARELGLIEMTGELCASKCRLTPEGLAFRQEQSRRRASAGFDTNPDQSPSQEPR
jgi:hypothetical protein